MGGRGSGSGFKGIAGLESAADTIARIRAEADAEIAAYEAAERTREEERAAARARAAATPLSDEARAVIARMTSRHHLHMSWARDYVRSDADILDDVRAQAPGATGFHVRSVPDEQGYATVEPEYERTEWGRTLRTPTAAERRAAEAERRRRGSPTPVSLRIRVIRNRDEERRT